MRYSEKVGRAAPISPLFLVVDCIYFVDWAYNLRMLIDASDVHIEFTHDDCELRGHLQSQMALASLVSTLSQLLNE